MQSLLIRDSFLLRIDYFSESSAILHILTAEGPQRLVSLSFLKKFAFNQDSLFLSCLNIEVNSNGQSTYVRNIELAQTYPISVERIYLLLYLRDMLTFFSQVHFDKKLYFSYRRFLHLLAHHQQNQYFYYAILSLQLLLLSLSGLGSASSNVRQIYHSGLMTLDDVENFHKKIVTMRCFFHAQDYIERLFEEHLGYSRPQGYFQTWLSINQQNQAL